MGILIIAIILISGCIRRPTTPTREELIQRFSEFESQLNEKKAEGYNVTEAEGFQRKVKQAFDRKDYRTANECLDKAVLALSAASKPSECGNGVCEPGESGYNCPGDCCISGDGNCPPGCEAAVGSPRYDSDCETGGLSRVTVSSVYERVNDGKIVGRSVDDVIYLLKETETNFIFRGWWVWEPCANSCSEVPPEVTYPYDCELIGYSYEHLKDAISEIKEEMPDVIFCGAIPAQRINFIEINPITGKVYNQQETNGMALDPAKWGITSITKEELQKAYQERGGKKSYFPDLTNPNFQALFLSRAEKQIDCGADAIWIDGLYGQARIFEKITQDSEHPAVKESFGAASKMVNEIHNYGNTKHNKHIYVGTWAYFLELPYTPPDLDFVTLTPSSREVTQKKMNNKKWDNTINAIREKLGDIKIFVFIDWGPGDAPMAIFSQKLSPDEQKEFLRTADAFFQSKGIDFIYPIHGGYMGSKATRLSGGQFRIYDSLAPEFHTYETIKNLAQNKSTKNG